MHWLCDAVCASFEVMGVTVYIHFVAGMGMAVAAGDICYVWGDMRDKLKCCGRQQNALNRLSTRKKQTIHVKNNKIVAITQKFSSADRDTEHRLTFLTWEKCGSCAFQFFDSAQHMAVETVYVVCILCTCLSSVHTDVCLSVFSAVLANKRVHTN